MGHHLIMGRKTFESISRLLPGRTTVIVTRQKNYHFSGARVAHSLLDAMAIVARDECPFMVGGAELYRQALPLVTRLFLTRVHAEVDGDTFLPKIDWDRWEQVGCENFNRDSKNEFDYSFEEYALKN
jgi:dihydrofolate reductase